MRQARQSLGYLYSTEYITRFFYINIAYIIALISRLFDFILASRKGNDVEPDFVYYLSRFI